jgi:hypothetical protein
MMFDTVLAFTIFCLQLTARNSHVFNQNIINQIEDARIYKEKTIHEQNNLEFRENSGVISPDGKKIAYFQDKFIRDNSQLGDKDYRSLIIESGSKKNVVFQGNFRLSTITWLSNRQISVIQGCGTVCVLEYEVDIYTKRYTKGSAPGYDKPFPEG